MSTSRIPWQRLVDRVSDGVCVLDAEQRVRYANPAALRLLGLPAPQGEPVAEWLGDMGEEHRTTVLKALHGQVRTRIQRANVEFPYLILEVEPLDDEPGTVVRVWRDFQGEAADVVAIMIHDLRKPMTSILGYAQMLLTVNDESLSETQRRFLETINRNVQRQNTNLIAVQDMTRIERGRIKLVPTSQSLTKVVDQALEALGALVEEKGHDIIVDVPEDLPPLTADGGRFRQILEILLDNAIKYTPPGGRIEIRGQTIDSLAQIDVQDNGIGIPAIERPHIFSQFFRGEADLINEHHGLGLNLYIARELVRLHGGEMWFESMPGKGSTFSFTLPLR